MDIGKLLGATGEVSSARVVMLVVAAVVLIKFVAFNAAALIAGHGPVAMDATDVALIGTAMGGKVLQNIFGEKK